MTSEESGGCPGCSKSSLDAKPISNGITAYDGFSGQYFRIFEYNFCSFVVAKAKKKNSCVSGSLQEKNRVGR